MARPLGFTLPWKTTELVARLLRKSVLTTGRPVTASADGLLVRPTPVSFDHSTTGEFVHTPCADAFTPTLIAHDCCGPKVIPEATILFPPGEAEIVPLPQLFEMAGLLATVIWDGRSFVKATPV